MRASLVSSALVLLLIACSNDETSQPPTTDTSTGTGAMASGGAGGEGASGGSGGSGGGFTGCHPLTNDAPAVEMMLVPQTLPAPMGGACGGVGAGCIRDGLYYLTALNRYTGASGGSGPTGTMWKETAQYMGPEVWVILDQFNPMGEQKYTFAYQPDDNGGINYLPLCPGAVSVPYDGYTFIDPDQLKLYASGPGVEWVYQIQGN